jgi:hypothetical protein
VQDLNLQEIVGVDDNVNISNFIMTGFLNSISKCETHKEIVCKIKNNNLLNHKQKLALLRYFRHNELYTQTLFNAQNLMRYVRQCLKYLPLTADQRMETEYVFSKIYKDRFKNTRSKCR